MSDAVFVSGLALHAYHGVMQHEAKIGQTFRLDLALDIDLAEASRSDKLAHTVGYDQVVEVASRVFCGRRYRLIEAAAGAVAEALLDGFAQVTAVRVTLHKPHAPIAAGLSDGDRGRSTSISWPMTTLFSTGLISCCHIRVCSNVRSCWSRLRRSRPSV